MKNIANSCRGYIPGTSIEERAEKTLAEIKCTMESISSFVSKAEEFCDFDDRDAYMCHLSYAARCVCDSMHWPVPEWAKY